MTNVSQAEEKPAVERTIWDKARPTTLKVVIGAVVAAGLIGAAAMIVGEFGPFHLRALLTVVMIVAFSLLVLYDAEVSSKRSHTFAFVGVIVSIYLLIAGILIVWISAFVQPIQTDRFDLYTPYEATIDIFEDFFQWVWLIIIARFALLHAHLLLNIHRKYSTPLLQLTAKVTMGLIALFGLLLSIPHIFDLFTYSDTYWRTVGAVFILDVLGTVLIPLSYALFNPQAGLNVTRVDRENPEAELTIWDKARPATLRVVIGAVVAAGLIGAAAMIVGEFGPFHLRALLTVFMIVLFSFMVLYDAEVSSKRSHTFAFVGVIVSIYLLIAGILMVWVPAFLPEAAAEYDTSSGYYTGFSSAALAIYGDFLQWVWLIIIARFALLHAHLLINIHRKYSTPLLQLTAKVTMGLIALFGLLLSLPHIFQFLDYSDTYWRVVGAVFILDVLGTVLIPLSYALFGPKPEPVPEGTYPPQYPQAAKPESWVTVPDSSVPVIKGRYVDSAPEPTVNVAREERSDVSTKPTSVQTNAASEGAHAAESAVNDVTPPAQPVPQPVTPPVQPVPQPQPQPAPSPMTPPAAPQPLPQAFKPAYLPPSGSVKFEKPPVTSRKLAWPRYEDGTPLPILPDGTPDFSAVERY